MGSGIPVSHAALRITGVTRVVASVAVRNARIRAAWRRAEAPNRRGRDDRRPHHVEDIDPQERPVRRPSQNPCLETEQECRGRRSRARGASRPGPRPTGRRSGGPSSRRRARPPRRPAAGTAARRSLRAPSTRRSGGCCDPGHPSSCRRVGLDHDQDRDPAEPIEIAAAGRSRGGARGGLDHRKPWRIRPGASP